MTDDRYVIPRPPEPDKTQLAPHPGDRRRTVIAIAIASFAAMFSGWQAIEAQRSRIANQEASEAQTSDVERARKAAEDSAKAAERSADAAWKSVAQLGALVSTGQAQLRTVQDQFLLQNRAYMTLFDMRTLFETTTTKVGIGITLQNLGRTAATDVVVLVRCEPVSGSQPTMDTLLKLGRRVNPLTTSIFPEKKLEFNEGCTATSASLDRRFAVWGNVAYRDILGCARWTHFCTTSGNTLHLMILMAAEMSLSGERL
jgi:hypothetical protein